ncbi:glycoside hydrolase family 54 protein [Periconia macrospinosa]|uniref:Alpha-L-arabinofuranosidase n=1 Tax=Periconia macrospinosa TaxID=97972 RepID=A0A2V1DCQ3_9PLEO|nr:glycoside hydrolase family 54 protein [Periconia macrospinosa]
MTSQRIFYAALAFSGSVLAGPCDIYASGNTPCVAAHATTRALYDFYKNALYQVQRASDSKTQDILPLTAGGVADADSQDKFCAGTSCVISMIYDQTGNGNNLFAAPSGSATPWQQEPDKLADATAAEINLDGKKAYGVYIVPGVGYRVTDTKNIVTGNSSESMYWVVDGTHYSEDCCFDYGNVEVNVKDTGSGAMETLYFGTCDVHGEKSGDGPWVAADLEDGVWTSTDQPSPSIDFRFFHSMLKGNGDEHALRGGDATNGTLQTYYAGRRPDQYIGRMNLTGAIVLGVGGDNSNRAAGTFYEGAMTRGYPSDETEDSVQANIVAAKYSQRPHMRETKRRNLHNV